MGERGGLNLYAIVGNNPINAFDILGLCQNEKPYCEVVYTAMGITPDQIKAAKDLAPLSGHTATFFDIIGFLQGAGNAGRSLEAIMAYLADAGRNQVGAEEMARLALQLYNEVGDSRGFDGYWRTCQKQCSCKRILGFTVWTSKTTVCGTWTKTVDDPVSDLGLGSYASPAKALEEALKQCEKKLK